jgi:hypothetical protein
LFGSFQAFLPLLPELVANEPKSDDDSLTSAADEPTALRDESSLKELGLADIAARHSSRPPGPKPPPERAASPGPAVRRSSQGSDLLGPDTGSHPPKRAPMRRRPPAWQAAGMSWTLTIVLATLLGTAVFYLVRLLKG